MLEKLSASSSRSREIPGRGSRGADVLRGEPQALAALSASIETCGKPWACAINGTAHGRRLRALRSPATIASPADNPKTRVGLPEIKVGLFPGAGGTQRIARMMPPADALQYLLKGDQLRTDRAKSDEADRRRRAGG